MLRVFVISYKIEGDKEEVMMIKTILHDFSIEKIAHSGQCFRCNALEKNKYNVIAFGKYLEIEQHGENVIFYCSKEDYEKIWYPYFDLGTDYKKFVNAVPHTDEYLTKAVAFGKGIRILKQDFWEMIISFLISQQNNIKRIKKIIELLCQTYGEKGKENGVVYYTFPSIEALSQATEQELKNCNLGYRGKYVIQTTKSLLQTQKIEKIQQMRYNEAKKELLSLYGVGEKVADCICLFGLHHLEAFPIDTHIKKILEKQYSNGFPFSVYEGYQGVIQQYLFYYDLFCGEKNV